MSHWNQFPGDYRPSSEGTWERLNEVAVKGAEYNSRERQPHSKCLEETRVDLLKYIHGVLDNRETNRLVWLHGTAGVGKSAVAFTVAERLKGLKVAEGTKENRLAGTFFFSRKHTKRCTTGYFFVTLAYQLASDFPSVREDVNSAIRNIPALLDPDKSAIDQMEALFLRPLRRLRFRLAKAPPLVFVVDALDECTSEPEIVELISLLGQALREPDLPVTHILLTSRSEDHIRKSIQTEEIRPLLCEIPVETSGEGVATTISLDGADVDNDIYIFFQHSFRDLKSRHPKFPQPSRDQLARLASRAGRRFIVASTMMKFIDSRDSDPRDQLQLMLELTSELLPGTEVYKLYDLILSTCADPSRAYRHLSVVAALADPLPLSQISELLGPGQDRDVETVLMQLRSVLYIPTDSSLPMNIHHSSIRDYVSDPSNCNLPQVQHVTSPHSLLALSSFRLMLEDIPKSAALLDALTELNRHSQTMQPQDPQNLTHALAFMVQSPEPLQVLVGLLWLRGYRNSDLQFWLETLDGCSWLQTQSGREWLRSRIGREWLQTPGTREWLQSEGGQEWLETPGGREWLKTQRGQDWLEAQGGRDWLEAQGGQDWLQTRNGEFWLQTQGGREWLQTFGGWHWLQTWCKGRDWLGTLGGQDWLQTPGGRDWLQTPGGRNWLQTFGRWHWPQNWDRQEMLHIPVSRDHLQTPGERVWLQSRGGRTWLQTQKGGQAWLKTRNGQSWLQTQDGWEWYMQAWLQTQGAGQDWLETRGGKDYLDILHYSPPSSPSPSLPSSQPPSRPSSPLSFSDQMQIPGGAGLDGKQRTKTLDWEDWLQIQDGRDWLQTLAGNDWLQTPAGDDWLQTQGGNDWLQTQGGRHWLETRAGEDWIIETPAGLGWMQTQGGKDWLQTQGGRHWLQTPAGEKWLIETPAGEDWQQTQGGHDWLQTQCERGWLQTKNGNDWLQTQSGRDWLQTQSGQGWLQTPHGQAWRLTTVWVTMEEFSSSLEAVSKCIIVQELHSQPAFQAVQQFKNLPDFLMLPAFLALRHQDLSTSALRNGRFPPDMKVIHAMEAFSSFANEAREQSRSASDALKYACQNWVVHISRARRPWDDRLACIFKAFWNHHLLSWLERQWCLQDLRSCLTILSKGEKLANELALQAPGSTSSQLQI